MLPKILEKAILEKASDIHVAIDTKPIIRIDGKLCFLSDFNKITRVDIENMIQQLLNTQSKNFIKELDLLDKDLDFSSNYKEFRLRTNIFRQKGSLGLAIRIIPKKIPSLEELTLPSVIQNFKHFRNGLILITGTSGSGKSTTLASIIENINQNESRNILILEDPIEYIYNNKKSIINQREIGKDVSNFQRGIKSAMRQDPDVLVIGELRDLETISSAVTLAETGHLVLGTMHSKSVMETISRVIDVFPSERQNLIRWQFSNSVRAVISQELVLREKGGRIANCEIMIVDDVIRNMIIKESCISNIEDYIFMDSSKLGSQTREQGFKKLINNGYVKEEYIFSLLKDKDKLKRLLIN